MAINGHLFQSQAKVYKASKKMDNALGTELDFAFGHVLHKSVSLQGGYSQMFASKTFEYLNNSIKPDDVQNWAYLMLIIRPNSEKKFIGIYN